jgi:hypothetical protein
MIKTLDSISIPKNFISAVMVTVVDAQREILLSPTGTNVWSGQGPQTANSAAVTWSLAKELYGFDGPYWIVPLSLIFGIVPTTIQWLISKVGHNFLHIKLKGNRPKSSVGPKLDL